MTLRKSQPPIAAEFNGSLPIWCPYCNHQYKPKNYTAKRMQEALSQHIVTCPRHPLHELMDVFGSLRRLIGSLLSSPQDDVFPKTSPLRKETEQLIKKADKIAAAFSPRKKS